jgi:nucleoside 2-deoxyribosyltransferase
MTIVRPRLYLAGPEVFAASPRDAGEAKRRLCTLHGFEGVFPLDAELDLSGLAKAEQATRISAANEMLMRSCDGLIANLTPFRGVSMDAGTAFEVGFMRALGRPVLGYTNVSAHYSERARHYRANASPVAEADRPDVDIEDFDLTENLMIEVAIRQSGGSVVCRTVPRGEEMLHLAAFEDCLRQARRIFGLQS